MGGREGPSRPGRHQHNLPVTLTDFVGRGAEVAQLRSLSERRRLVTLVGPGGAGKTRLAVEVARELLEEHPDGVWFSEMSGLDAGGGVASELARAMSLQVGPGSSADEVIRTHLGTARSLVILDNCDHVVPACAELAATLLADCPEVRVWATSRQVLGLDGEATLPVAPLRVPPDSVATPTEALGCESVQLFVAVASQMVRGFTVDDENFSDVCHVCRRLDGLPLAIELAAARCTVLTPAQICARLDDRFHLLTTTQRGRLSPFHTLHSALAWSYELLDQRGKALLQQLAVFADTASLDAVAFVGGWDETDLLDTLQSLVSKSLVTVDRRPRVARYGLLESIRAFVLDEHVDPAHLARLHDRHLLFYLDLAHRLHAAMRTAAQVDAVDEIRREHKNLVHALESASAKGDADLLQRLAAWLWLPWFRAGRWSDARDWIDRAVRLPIQTEPSVYVELLLGRSYLATFDGAYDEARQALDTCMQVAADTGDVAAQLQALLHTGIMEGQQGDLARARATFEAALALARGIGNEVLVERCLSNLAVVAIRAGDTESAVPLLDEGLALSRSRGDEMSQLAFLNALANATLERGDYHQAAELVRRMRSLDAAAKDRYTGLHAHLTATTVALHCGEWSEAWSLSRAGLDLATDIGDHEAYAQALESSAAVVARSDLITGAVLLGAADAVRASARTPRPPSEQHSLQLVAPALFDAVERDAAARDAWHVGHRMDRHEIAEYVANLASPAVAPDVTPHRIVEVETASLRREGEYWTVHFQGRVARVKHVVGLDWLAVLLAHPGDEVYSLTLSGVSTDNAPSRTPLLDEQAKREYRGRLDELEALVHDAESAHDIERAAECRAEHDVLVRELSRAVGLGGRDRPGTSDAERARVRTTKALRHAIAGLARVDVELGRHLESSVRTGSFCSYTPTLAEPITWDVRC
jgi:predicted ATPase